MVSLGGTNLRQLVLDAAAAEEQQLNEQIDFSGVVWLEHINLVVGCHGRSMAEAFYLEYLGFTKDASKSFHFNLGQQQLHLAEADGGFQAQRVTGSFGLTVPSLDTIRERTAQARQRLEGTSFSVLDDSENCITVSCPWGNKFNLYSTQNDDDNYKNASGSSSSSQVMVVQHSAGGAYGPHRMAVRGQPGIRYIEIACRPGTAERIGHFYRKVLRCHCHILSTTKEPAIAVAVAPGVHLIYAESERLSDVDLEAMNGIHICIYTIDFGGLYHRLKQLNLIWTNPRFTYLDSCNTWQEAVSSRTLRFKDIVDIDTGEKLVELEHETRPLRHGQYMKVPKYQPR